LPVGFAPNSQLELFGIFGMPLTDNRTVSD